MPQDWRQQYLNETAGAVKHSAHYDAVDPVAVIVCHAYADSEDEQAGHFEDKAEGLPAQVDDVSPGAPPQVFPGEEGTHGHVVTMQDDEDGYVDDKRDDSDQCQKVEGNEKFKLMRLV